MSEPGVDSTGSSAAESREAGREREYSCIVL